jgi:hydroxymethylpyrimidine pyrophosphatase-like HAD family hydrolase
MSCRLLALDLDGTLLRDDGSIAADDQAAIAEARARGIAVTIATGRLPASTLPHARTLELDAALVCADGAVTVAARDGAITRTRPLPETACERVAALGTNAGLSSFFLTPEALLAHTRDSQGHRLASLRGFTENVRPFAGDLKAVAATALHAGRPIIAGFLVGAPDHVHQAADVIRGEEQEKPVAEVEPEAFPLGEGGLWAVRVRCASSTKASGLAGICAEQGIAAAEVAVVGDWYNDMSMLSWAGLSFVMGGAPVAVARLARTQLKAKAGAGGGIAEAVSWLLRAHSQH